ncbi:hypothetical protein [Streptomyces canus]|uniref:hypothetical protein n=1 Tax=Streptomyces canus TaxID=58343 RepID=UPI00382E9800
MSEPYITFPDVEQLVVDLLKDRSELAGVVVDVAPPSGFDGSQRAVLVSRVGGPRRSARPGAAASGRGPRGIPCAPRPWRGRTPPGRPADCRAGRPPPRQAVIDVVEEDGPRWLPDYRHAAANRYVSTTRLVVRPA